MKTFQSVGKGISVLYRYTQSYLKKNLEPFHVGAGQLPILLSLFQKEYVRQVDLATRLQLDKTSLARTISKLESNGYLQRNRDDQDNRAYNISLTHKARKFKDKLVPILKSWTRILMRDFTQAEQDQFIAFLRKAAQNAENELKGDGYDTSGTSD
jgi:DNA-binding MarR family transcriptional regulator